jgi:HEAT repeats
MGLVVLAGACRATPLEEGASGAFVLRLDARSSGSFEGRGQAAWIDDVVAEGLAHARWFRAEGSGPELVARLRFEERTTPEGVPVLHAHLVVEPDPALAAELAAAGESLDAHVELERRDHTIELRRDLPVAVERALALVDAKVTTVRGSLADLEGLLADTDPEVILVALAGVERRRLHALGDRVFGVLEHPEERVALRAVECLGAIGRPEHAPGLVRMARLADRAHANRLYDALANLGGEHARGFLAFAARNEDDPELASLAERALARLDAAEPSRPPDAVARGHRQ